MGTKEVERKELAEGDRSVHQIRVLLDNVDQDRNGYISFQELQDGLLSDAAALQILGVSKEELEVLHTALDTDGAGEVGIAELLFGVLKLVGTSKTVDMLSIDYKQKVFLRDITDLHKAAIEELGPQPREEELARLSDALRARIEARPSVRLAKIVSAAAQIKQNVHQMQSKIRCAQEDLLNEIAQEEQRHEAAVRLAADEAALKAARLPNRNEQLRKVIESSLTSMRAQAEGIALSNHVEGLTATDSTALRGAIRRRLDTQLGPWLDRELAETGGRFA